MVEMFPPYGSRKYNTLFAIFDPQSLSNKCRIVQFQLTIKYDNLISKVSVERFAYEAIKLQKDCLCYFIILAKLFREEELHFIMHKMYICLFLRH